MIERLQEAVDIFSDGGFDALSQHPALYSATIAALCDKVREKPSDFTIPVPGPSYETAQGVASSDHKGGVRLPRGGIPTQVQINMLKQSDENIPKIVLVAGDVYEEIDQIRTIVDKLKITPVQVVAVVGVTALEGVQIWEGDDGKAVEIDVFAQLDLAAYSDLTLATN